MVLTDLEPPLIGKIVSFKGNKRHQIRLIEMGFKPEQKVRLIRKMAFNGPIQVRVETAQFPCVLKMLPLSILN